MNRLYLIIITILCCAAVPVAIAGDIVKHYATSEETKDTHYDIEQNRIGHTEWDNDDTGSHYDKEYNRSGYSKKYKDKETLFDNSWNRKGYKK
jgi:uncharacterized protein YxeA